MRFLFRSFIGLLIFSLTLGVLFFAGFYLFDAIKTRSEKPEKKRYQRERIFAVNVAKVELEVIAPKIFSYGELANTTIPTQIIIADEGLIRDAT